jgi:Ta0938
LKVAENGCAICQATWGDYWETIEGTRMFFCCNICAVEFRNMVDEVKKRTGWRTVDEIKMVGNYRGRECTALFQGKSYRFYIRFDSRGGIDLCTPRA